MTTPTEAPREALPELPEARTLGYENSRYEQWPIKGYDEEDMRAYAQSALESERQAHAAEVERLRGDAERYRWLRDKSEWEPFDSRWLIEVDIYGTPSSEMDAAIDQAIARGTK